MSIKQTTLSVEGMTCGACVRHVTTALRALDGVRDVNVDLQAATVIVDHDYPGPALEAMVTALDDAGYASRPKM